MLLEALSEHQTLADLRRAHRHLDLKLEPIVGRSDGEKAFKEIDAGAAPAAAKSGATTTIRRKGRSTSRSTDEKVAAHGADRSDADDPKSLADIPRMPGAMD